MGNLHADQYTFMIISPSVLLGKKMFETQVIEKIKARVYVQ